METKKLKQVVSLLVGKNNTLPVLDNVFISNGDVIVTDLEIRIRIKNFFDQKFSTLVNAKKFVNFLELAKPLIVFEEGPNNSFNDLSGKVSLGKADKIENYPCGPSPKESVKKAKIRPEDIQKYSVASKFISDDKTRPVMNCVWHGNYIVASDACVLYFSPAKEIIEEPILIPEKVIKLLEIYSGEYNAVIDDKNIFLSSDDIDISFRNPDGNFPEWKRVVPESFNLEINVNLKEFVKAIDYVKPYMNKYSEIIKVEVLEGALKISSKDIDFDTSAEIQISSESKILNDIELPLDIGFKYSFMKKICGITKDDTLTIKIVDSARATLFGGVILMPMMLNS